MISFNEKGAGKMKSWLEKVREEKKDLDYKIAKLEIFMQTVPNNLDISIHSMYLLSEQLVIMKRYSYVLGERIKEGEKNGV